MQTYGKLDSKFRYVILAAKRAKQLLKGAKPKIRTKSRNPIRIAQLEVKEGLIDFEILQANPEDGVEEDKEVFTAEDEIDDTDTGPAGETDYEEEGAEPEAEDDGELEDVPEDESGPTREDE